MKHGLEMRTFRFDPRVFIRPPFIRCPKCGKESFGVLNIFRNGYSRRCKECLSPTGQDPSATYPLPELKKKIIYIDQLGISNMMKALNPRTKAHREGRIAPFWLQLFQSLDSLCKLQLIICPESGFHTEESLASPWYDHLKRMYQLLSHGVCFHTPQVIRTGQLLEHARNWIAGEPAKPLALDSRSVMLGEVDAWQERWAITAEQDYDESWVDELRQERARKDNVLNRLFAQWQSEKNASFDTWYRREALGYGKGYLESYARWICRIWGATMQAAAPTSAVLLPPPAVGTITAIQYSFREAGIGESEIVTRTMDFFTSDSLLEVPVIKVAAMMTAAMARQASEGRKTPPGRGFRNDVRIISTLLPYCDAMLVDNECRHLLAQNPLRDASDYGTKVFSADVGPQFLEYLDDIRANTPDEHFEKVREVYGEDWPKPFTTLYTYDT